VSSYYQLPSALLATTYSALIIKVFLDYFFGVLITEIMKTILLIEDNQDILENLTEYFEIEGYRIAGTRSGRTGVEIASDLVPDLIICDVLMPVMDGYEVLNLLLHKAKTFNIPFIFSTSMSESVDREEALKLGADDYIVKPFELDLLLRMAESWIKSGSSKHEQNPPPGNEVPHLKTK
jgi:CheY-like chemotaxis protein